MAAVTFTRKAASELRGRFHLALEARLESARKAQGAGGRDPAAAGGTLESRALLRRHYSLVLRAFAARAARGVRRVARLHRAGRSAGPRAAPARVARVHHRRARGGRPGCGGIARGRHQAEGPRLRVCDGLRQRRCGVSAGGSGVSGPEACGESAGRVLEKVPETYSGVDPRRHQVRHVIGGAAVRRPVARGAEAAPPTGGRRGPARCVGPRVQDHDEMVVGRQSRGKEDPCGNRRSARELSCGRGGAVPRRVAAVHLPAFDSPPHPRAKCRLQRAVSPELAELRRPAQSHRTRAARERRRTTGTPAEVPVLVGRRVPGHRSRAGRDRLLAGRG